MYTAIIRYTSAHNRDMDNEFFEGANIAEVRRKAIEGSASNCPRSLEILDPDYRTLVFPGNRTGHEQIKVGHKATR